MLPLLAMSTLDVDPIQVAGDAVDSTAMLGIDNKTPSSDNDWRVHVTTGTLKRRLREPT